MHINTELLVLSIHVVAKHRCPAEGAVALGAENFITFLTVSHNPTIVRSWLKRVVTITTQIVPARSLEEVIGRACINTDKAFLLIN